MGGSRVRRRVPKGEGGDESLHGNACDKMVIPFTVRVLESAQKEMITYRDVSDYLSVGLKHLPAVETLAT